MKKNNIAFYFPNKGYTNINIEGFRIGNPGIGGSEYAILLIADELARTSNRLNVSLYVDKYSDNLNNLSSNLNIVEVSDTASTVVRLEENEIDYFIVCYGYYDSEDFWASIPIDVKMIFICECFLPMKKLKEYAKNKHIARLIAVGQEQLDLYRDHSAFNKSDFIYNPIPDEQIEEARLKFSSNRASNTVTYMGSLTPAKSFDVLAKAWPEVIKVMPNARLNVIGGGNLYNRNWSLGKWGLAEESFENNFMKYLVDSNGSIIPSVKFWGVLGPEKNEILRKSWVGIPNPTGTTETYGFVAVEMQLAGCLVATQKCPGFLDTVVSKQAILYDDPSRLANSIIKLLKERNITQEDTLCQIENKFSLTKICSQWEKLILECIPNDTYLHDRKKIVNKDFAFKRVREFNRLFSRWLPFRLPSVLFCEFLLFRLKIRVPYYLKY